MEPLSPGQQAALAALQKVDPNVTEEHFRGLDPAVQQQVMQKVMMSGPSDITNDVGVDTPGMATALNLATAIPRGVGAGGRAVLHAARHPLDTAGGMQDMFFNALFSPVTGSNMAGQSVGARGGVPIRPSGGTVGTETPGAISPDQASLAGRQLATSPLYAMGLGGAAAAGALSSPSANPEDVLQGAGQGLGMAGMGEALARPVVGMAQDAGNLLNKARYLPESSAAKALSNTTVPSSGGTQGMANALKTYAPEVQGVIDPMLFESSKAGMQAMKEAAATSPELYAWLKQKIEARGKTPGIAEAIEAKRNTELGPQFDAFKAETTPFDIGGAGHTVAEASSNPAAAQALREAMRNGWMPKSPTQVIPGTGEGNWLANDQNILAAAKKLPKGGVPPGTPIPDIAGGEVPTQGQAFAIKKILDEQLNHAQSVEDIAALKASKNRLDSQLRAQSPQYDALSQEWARRSQLADQYREQVGTFKLPKPPQTLRGHTPLGMSPQSLITRPGVFDFLDQWRRAKAQSAGAMLGAQTTGTPVSINDVLAQLTKNRKGGPPPTPAYVPPPTPGTPAPPPRMAGVGTDYSDVWAYPGSAREPLRPKPKP